MRQYYCASLVLLLFMYKCKQLIIFPITICLYMSPDCLEPRQLFMHLSLYKNPCCIIMLIDEIAVQLPNFAVVFVARRVPAHCEPRTVHHQTAWLKSRWLLVRQEVHT